MTETITLAAAGGRMAALFALPNAAGPHPAALVMHHRGGLDAFTRQVVEHLAAAGFAALAPDLYHRRPAAEDRGLSRQHLRDTEILADIDAALQGLRARPEIRREDVAILGHCMGGRFAYLGAASVPTFKGAAVFYGGNIFVADSEGGIPPATLTGNIRCPVMGFFGKDDQNPSPADVARLDALLEQHGIRHEFHSYDGAGHAFQNATNPAAYRAEAAEDAWRRVLAFLHQVLPR